MGFGAFSSDSTAKQETVNVSGQGQYNRKSDIAQGGGVLIGRNAKLGNNDLKGNKGAVTINNGPSAADLKSLLGNITSATPAQIQESTPATPAPVTSDSLAAKTTEDAAAKQKKLITYGAIAAVLLVAAGFFFRKR